MTFSMRLDEGLRGRLEERAVLEGRSLANVIERLLELGLGQVVTERSAAVVDSGPVVQPSPDGVGLGRGEDARPGRSVTSCAAAENHVPGVKCLVCDTWVRDVREVKTDFKKVVK